jgi:hypothetical protein
VLGLICVFYSINLSVFFQAAFFIYPREWHGLKEFLEEVNVNADRSTVYRMMKNGKYNHK